MTDAEMLQAARAAHFKLISGQAVAEVDFGTYRTSFHKGDLAALDRKIAQLEAAVNATASRGAIGIVF